MFISGVNLADTKCQNRTCHIKAHRSWSLVLPSVLSSRKTDFNFNVAFEKIKHTMFNHKQKRIFLHYFCNYMYLYAPPFISNI